VPFTRRLVGCLVGAGDRTEAEGAPCVTQAARLAMVTPLRPGARDWEDAPDLGEEGP